MIETLRKNTLLLAALAWLVWLAVTTAWPASYWLEVRAVRVADARVGAPILMVVDRSIHRHFFGSWTASVREVGESNGRVSCAASALSEYMPDADIPDALDLGWWTNGRCERLPAGRYTLHTAWVIDGGLLPDKRVSAVSNIFEVTR